ncbi:Putative KHG/KDPG aldolase [Rosistilla carotiformis]|uniref:2-dehydro-3-deoxy-phosphogluconate aldolase n=1 Tax=Rosistilla carotiformis TaxID=2528017 RepID=A0A518JWX8_9BACT|nr:bifunctional 4-hydroxy-2-oxoglutarate aldolase/2-dehydro-3-deoxy-phosphogluconate aldolase [Rosistilla carotiformis]QDV70050.1 Putative KHG/KDPG aldolase [Rosistilla carotiformis]
MKSQFPDAMLARMQACGVVAVIVIDEPQHAVPLAQALLAGGIQAIELTLRTPAALDAIAAIATEVPDVLVGAGTVLTTDQVDAVIDAGAAFAVAPGLNRRVVERSQARGLPFAPGIVTPSDIELAVELGCRELKFFPAEPSGGMRYLNSMAAPYAHLGLQFIPLGGLDAKNMASYLSSPLVPAIGGSWIAPRKLIQQKAWAEITENATEASRIVAATQNKEIA